MNPQPFPNPLIPATYRIDAAGAIDASARPISVAPASILLDFVPGRIRVLATDSPAGVDRHPAASGATRIHLPSSLITPAFVNAHTHLDLTHIGPQPRSGFAPFVDLVRARRHFDPALIRESVLLGARLSIAGGVAAVGDIAGAVRGGASIEPFLALRDSGLAGVSFLEFFAIGESIPRALARMDAVADEALALPASPVRFGLQPHAPYSVSPAGYRHAFARAVRDSLPIATHLAESIEEREFIATATGPQRAMLEALGLWKDSLLTEFGQGKSPVAHLAAILQERDSPVVLVHLNDLSDGDVELLADLNAHVPIHVAYCPRASDFFGAPDTFGTHRYRELLGAGINVCLGTDSIINLPEAHAGGNNARISPLDDARLLARRENTDATVLLQMLTVRGASALGLDPARFSLREGSIVAGLCAIPAASATTRTAPESGELWRRALSGDDPPSRLF